MAGPSVKVVQKETNPDAGAKQKGIAVIATTVKKIKFSWIHVIVPLSFICVYGVGAVSVKKMWAGRQEKIQTHIEEKAKKAKEFETKLIQHPLTPFQINIATESEGLKQLSLQVSLELTNEYSKKEFLAKEDQIRDDLVILLSAKREDELKVIEGRNKVREEILSRINKFMSAKSQVKQVYFSDFLIQ